MDPNAMLAHARERMNQAGQPDLNMIELLRRYADAAHAYAELDGWLTQGGYLPAGWARAIALPNAYTNPNERGACPIARFDHASPPYGPGCLLDQDHEGDHEFPPKEEQ